MIEKAAAITAMLVWVLFGTAPAAALEPGDLTLTVTPELSGNARPYAREMVLLKLRGVYRTQILLEEMRQPPLTNFSWTQLGRDSWTRTQLPDGQMALLYERTIAIFPQHTGTFTIEPFVHNLTVNDDGRRKTLDVRSAPIELPVAHWRAESGGPDAPEPWWLPARDVTITDSWDPDPEAMNKGDTARRIVVLQAQGMLAEGLPPRPIMRTRGIITFAGPVKRETIITPGGPVARATYQWDLRKGVPEVIALEGIQIPWFDTASRTMRVVEIPARQIGGGLPDREADVKDGEAVPWAAVAAAGLAAFGLGIALMGFGSDRQIVRLRRTDRRALLREAAAGDAVAFRIALVRIMTAEPDLAGVWHREPETVAALEALDAAVYGLKPLTGRELAESAKVFSLPRKASARSPAEETRLAPLDGAAQPLRGVRLTALPERLSGSFSPGPQTKSASEGAPGRGLE